ncbi:hypothetical protein SK803_16985 [Lentzea sp. BCCO 10_0856]|uniref:Uncharacterized protein n=1 Tax=Lentzea miocenica TaxID=3095431 RepID=A0ABU4T188_9PSEU|nr:hypothetical protein [Lentzea sp. BCCO 10_0856]MDX8031922.1 hypothetical protein [Lentzea sp. BCCO 10_0856]
MNVEPLVRAIVSAFMFLEHSGADEINPDAAAQGEENIGDELALLNGADRVEFRRVLEEIAASSSDPGYAEFVRGMPLMLWGPDEN